MMKVKQVLVVDLLQESEGQGLDRLADVVQRGPALLPRAFSTSCLATSRPPARMAMLEGLAPANSWIAASCSSPVTEPSLAISMETASTCLGSSLLINCAACSSGRLMSKMAALRRSEGMAGVKVCAIGNLLRVSAENLGRIKKDSDFTRRWPSPRGPSKSPAPAVANAWRRRMKNPTGFDTGLVL